ncbi:hypothetical protein FB107DRAFT_268471 [Schizophyllum commune]
MLALLHFGTLSLHIHGAYQSSSTSWQHLTPYIPVVIDWLEYVHPSNGHIEVIPTAGACCTPNVVLSVLRGLCKPGLHGEDTPSTKTCGFLSQTPVLSWLLDLWLDFDLGDYNASIQEDFIQQIIIQLCKFAYGDYHPAPGRHISDSPSETMQLPYELLALIRQKTGRRKLCHIISRWAEALQERPDDEGCAKAFFLFALSLLTVPELLPQVYPREALKRLLRCLDRHLSLGHYDTVATGFVYLECIWIAAMDHRALQWSITEGIFTTCLRTAIVAPEHPEVIAMLGRLADTLRQSLAYWRVLDVFRRKHGPDLPRLRLVSRKHPLIADILVAYDARIEQLDEAEADLKEKKGRCSNDECPNSEAVNEQRQDWRREHSGSCLSGGKKRGKTSARDIHFIGCLVFNYWRKNEQRIVGEALALDPLRAHRVQVHVDLRPAVICHTIRLVEETSNGEGAWTMELYAGWLDSGTYRNILCEATEMPEVHEGAA